MKYFFKLTTLLLTVISFQTLNATNVEIKVGASSKPHAEILEFVKPMLKKQGINLKIIVFQDYILPNKALDSHDLDANFFQHTQYLKEQMQTYGYKFVNIADIHIEPIGVYSKRHKSTSDISSSSTIIISNSISDRSRILRLLEKNSLLSFKKGTDISKADLKDISNTKLKFMPVVDPALLPRLYLSDEADLIVINTNYAMEAGINPINDALILEDKSSPYVNILVAREDNANNPAILALSKELKSIKTANFIHDKYKGSVIPITTK